MTARQRTRLLESIHVAREAAWRDWEMDAYQELSVIYYQVVARSVSE